MASYTEKLKLRKIEYDMRNIFLEKSYIKCGRETSSSPFSENPKFAIFLHQHSKSLYSLLKLHVQVEELAYIQYFLYI